MSIKQVLTNPELLIGCVVVLVFAVIAVVAPLISPPQGEDPYMIPRDGFSITPKPPGPGHPLGTMQNQYDVLYGLTWGTRMAFRVGVMIQTKWKMISLFVLAFLYM